MFVSPKCLVLFSNVHVVGLSLAVFFFGYFRNNVLLVPFGNLVGCCMPSKTVTNYIDEFTYFFNFSGFIGSLFQEMQLYTFGCNHLAIGFKVEPSEARSRPLQRLGKHPKAKHKEDIQRKTTLHPVKIERPQAANKPEPRHEPLRSMYGNPGAREGSESFEG